MHKLVPLACALALVGCSKSTPPSDPAEEPAQSERVGESTRPEQVEEFNFDKSSFGSTILDCKKGEAALGQSAWVSLRVALSDSANPTLKYAEVNPAKFIDTTGWVVRLTYNIEPGDPGVIEEQSDTILVSETCNSLLRM